MNYLYNGVEFPDINPVWTDKVTYPYVIIFVHTFTNTVTGLTETGTYLWFLDNAPYVFRNEGTSGSIAGGAIIQSYKLTGGNWEYDATHEWPAAFTYKFDSVIYANFDLLDSDGTLYLAASDPVPVIEVTIPRKADRYSYNGMQSPDIYTAYTPELQAEYPYAVLFNRPNYDSYITLIISKKPCYVDYSHIVFNIGHSNLKWDEDGAVLEFHDLVFYSDGVTLADSKANLDDVGSVWSNHDILYAEDYNSRYDIDGNPSSTPDPLAGTLYLAASDPIPIPILAPALDPLSLFMGWKAGNWVARQRGKA